MKSNFEFLDTNFPLLAKITGAAENYHSDPNACLFKLGMYGETIVKMMFDLDKIEPPQFDNTHASRIRLLKKEGLIPHDIDNIL
jgi:hypothetical protein